MTKILTTVLGLGLLLPGVAAVAAPRDDRGRLDPDRVICRTIDATGSRLKVVRTCMTSAEWARQKAEERQTVERAQTDRH